MRSDLALWRSAVAVLTNITRGLTSGTRAPLPPATDHPWPDKGKLSGVGGSCLSYPSPRLPLTAPRRASGSGDDRFDVASAEHAAAAVHRNESFSVVALAVPLGAGCLRA